jgi:enoyl-CoA hydratase/carnithine racemase
VRALAVAAKFAELPPLAVRQTKESVPRGTDALPTTGRLLEPCRLRTLVVSQDQKNDMGAFIE